MPLAASVGQSWLRGSAAEELAGLTISVVALSILIHGMSARPLLARYERGLK